MKFPQTIKFVALANGAVLPTKAHDSDAGYDVTIIRKVKDVKINGKVISTMYGTGVSVSPPPGFHTELIARSSLGMTGYMISHCVGVIDRDYQGEVMVCLTKLTPDAPDIELPLRCAQLVIRKTYNILTEVVGGGIAFVEPEMGIKHYEPRGANGFGSTDEK